MKTFFDKQYPFQSQFLNLKGDIRLHYVDEGQGRPILMVHGNPSWSFLYRNVILGLKDRYRCVALDHIGCGFSDKPQDYPYCLSSHIDNLKTLIDHLKLKEFDLIVHDWGGAIGLKVAQDYSERIGRIVILNTAAFPSRNIPWRIWLCKVPFLGALLVRGGNAFVRGACSMAVTSQLSENERLGFSFPYDNWKNRIAIYRFIRDIPLNKKTATYEIIKKMGDNFFLFKEKNVHIIWGMKDFCFGPDFLEEFIRKIPHASVKRCDHAGHYLLEEKEALESVLSCF